MRPIDVIKKVTKSAKQIYIDAFEQNDQLFIDAEINTPLRLAHFLAQVLEETGGLTIFEESGNYSAKRICEVWPSRFKSIAVSESYAHNAEKLFNSVYANRMGNGPPSSGDGYKYRGRGPLQTTGKEAYAKYGKRLGLDLVNHPELIFTVENVLKPSLYEWTEGHCNNMADKDDIKGITLKINGGYTNLPERQNWLNRLKPIISSVELSVNASPLPTPRPVVIPEQKVEPAVVVAPDIVPFSDIVTNTVPAVSVKKKEKDDDDDDDDTLVLPTINTEAIAKSLTQSKTIWSVISGYITTLIGFIQAADWRVALLFAVIMLILTFIIYERIKRNDILKGKILNFIFGKKRK